MQFNAPGKKESKTVVITVICLYGKTKKMKVGATTIQPDGSDKKEIRKRGQY